MPRRRTPTHAKHPHHGPPNVPKRSPGNYVPVTDTSERYGTLGDMPSPTTEIVGNARVSTGGQDLALQLEALNNAGAERIYQDVGSSGRGTLA